MSYKALQEASATHPAADQATSVLVRRLLATYVRPQAGRVAAAMACMLLFAGATAALAYLMKPVLDDVFIDRDETMLVIVPALIVVVGLVKGLSNLGQAILMQQVSLRVIARLQNQMFGHLMGADLAFFHATASGVLIARFTNDVTLLRRAIAGSLTGMVKDTVTFSALLGLLLYHDWVLALASFTVFPIAVVPIVWIGRRTRKISRASQVEIGRMTSLLGQAFQGVRHVKSYSMEDYEAGRAEHAIERIRKLTLRSSIARALGHPVMELLGGLAIAGVIFYGGGRVVSGETTTGTLFSFITALILAYEPLKRIMNLNANLQEGLAAAQRVFALLDLKPKIVDRADAHPLEVTGGGIVFEDVHFAYAPDKTALHGLTLEVPAGKTAALVGASGGGKSTILNLIPRFFDLDAGRVAIDGQDVRDVTLASLRANIALVSQEVSLFDDSVRANIAYGRPGAGDAAIEACAKAAAAHDFIAALPNGYDTLVGENGVTLSGGQRQRIAIARAMLKDAPILLLDEATSALDSESERQVQAALGELMQGRTTLVVAHRLSTIVDADIIYVIGDGRVIEAGSHGELIARRGAYAQLYTVQGAEAGPAVVEVGPPGGRARA